MAVKVLISEDTPYKAQLLSDALSTFEISGLEIIFAKNGYETRCALREHAGTIDLLLLDLVLPNREGDTPSASVGIELLRQILEDEEYLPPTSIVGTTADNEAMDEYEESFKNLTTQILLITPELTAWRFSLEKLISRIVRSQEHPKERLVDVCFITALRYPELTAVLGLPVSWTPEQSLGNGVLIQEGTAEIDGKLRKFVCAHSSQMGMIAASFMTRVLWEKYYPKLIVMTGICGGVRNVNLGDVIVADRSWDWQSGKWLHSGEFDSAPDHKEASPDIVALARGTEDISLQFWKNQDQRPETQPKIHVGPMLSGSAVVEDPSKHAIFVKQHRKAIAVDMECYGVYFAADMSVDPQSKFICIKCVSDLADRNKADNYQKYCADLSATIGFEVALKFLRSAQR
ncbi:phosphorylase family protein [Pseudomonas asiatica]|uniref:5'-methylthioadenosine/S-adenosylhomocysteine nucleosidase family protein n=1 Tax=Pseudomonas asiatica TaxID=2219225 RepID=UPI0037CB558C